MSEEINKMFSSIHKKYDFMNHALSLGMDNVWRAKAARESIVGKKQYSVLDVAAGTGDLAIAIKRECDRNGKEVKVIGVDFNKDMLGVAREKVRAKNLPISFEIGDALKLEFPDGSFDVITSGFALRDFDDLDGFVRESFRVLNKGGKIVLMDMAKPDNGLSRYFFSFYSRIMLLEGMLADRNAYSFLVNTIKEFDKGRVAKVLEKNGFCNVKIMELPTRVAFIITAVK